MADLDPFEPTNISVEVWRYSQLWKLLSALQTQKLYLALLDVLKTKFDPYEASVPESTHNDQVPIFAGNSAMQQFFGSEEPAVARAPWERPGEDSWTRVARLRRGLLRCAHVSCWRWGEESEAMWRLYCPGEDGVAIRTTFAKLRDSVTDPHTCVSEVKYFDYKTGRFLRHIHDWDPAFHKRIAFKHEQEVRVLRHDVADWRRASEDDAFRLPSGHELQWDPVAVIDEIIVNPQSAPPYCDTVQRAVADVAPALADRVKRSALVTEPVRY
jgi:Protein of unknown function (DUF2971)